MPTPRFSFTNRFSASNKVPRQINRNLIFNQIRIKQPISRADLARASGLQRSTVSLIVEELIAERWIVEGSMGRLPRGRRPTFLLLNDKRGVLALDIHPSQTTLAEAEEGTRQAALGFSGAGCFRLVGVLSQSSLARGARSTAMPRLSGQRRPRAPLRAFLRRAAFASPGASDDPPSPGYRLR